MINNWMLSWDCTSPALKHSDLTFKKKKKLSKNVNLDEKKSTHSEESQKKKCKFR